MLKYVDAKVTFSEIPDEITLCINLSNCPCKCENCHSSYLAKDIGKVLTITKIERLLKENKGITAICFMGGDNDPKLVNHYAKLIKNIRVEHTIYIESSDKDLNLSSKDISIKKDTPIKIIDYERSPIKIGWYSGKQELSKEIDLWNFDYIKVGPYREECGPLSCPATNQIFYKVFHFSSGKSKLIDITYRFWKNNN